MTREEVKKIFGELLLLGKAPCQKEELEDLCKIVLSALEQEPIIDKIRAEIDRARFIDKDTRICKNALASGLEVAMQIIDKYKAETEET